jgi:hypothetical protein
MRNKKKEKRMMTIRQEKYKKLEQNEKGGVEEDYYAPSVPRMCND